MRYANNKKASQDEQQNQTTKTNINYIKNFMSVLKTNLNNKVKIASKKLKLNKITCNSPEKVWDHSKMRLGNN